MNVNDVLIEAAKLIEEVGHCKGSFAKNDDGATVSVSSGLASSYCLVGSILRVGLESGERENLQLIVEAKAKVEEYLGMNPVSFNDSARTTKHDVSHVLRSAANS